MQNIVIHNSSILDLFSGNYLPNLLLRQIKRALDTIPELSKEETRITLPFPINTKRN